MKPLFFLFSYLCTITVFAQSSIVIFSERGDTFVLRLNGKPVNGSNAMALVRAENISSGKTHIHLSFTKKGVPDLNEEINIPNDGNIHEVSYKVVPSQKGSYTLTWVSDILVNKGSGVVSSGAQNNNSEKGKGNSKPNNEPKGDGKANDKSTANVNVSTNSTGNNLQLSMSTDNTGANQQNNNATISLNVTGMGNPANNSQTNASQQQPASQVPQVQAGLVCNNPNVNQQAFMQFKYKISSSYLDMNKAKDAKDFMNNNCMLSQQVAELVKLIQLNESQLDVAEFGYMHTYDQANFGVVVNALLADYNKEKLLAFIGSYGSAPAASVNNNVSVNSNSSYSQNVTITTSGNMNGTSTTGITEPKHSSNENSNSNYSVSTCSPMNEDDFQEALDAADEPVGEDAKMQVAKSVFDDHCISTDQVLKVMDLFVSEDRKLDFAKFAYSRTSDKDKYFRVNKAFISEERITNLTEFVKNNKH